MGNAVHLAPFVEIASTERNSWNFFGHLLTVDQFETCQGEV